MVPELPALVKKIPSNKRLDYGERLQYFSSFTEISDSTVLREGGEGQANNAYDSLDGNEAASVSCFVRNPGETERTYDLIKI